MEYHTYILTFLWLTIRRVESFLPGFLRTALRPNDCAWYLAPAVIIASLIISYIEHAGI